MSNEIVLWNSPNGASLPTNITNINQLTQHINMLSSKEVIKIQNAINFEFYDMATLYTWNRTISILREKVLSFGKEFVLEMLGRSDGNFSDPNDYLSDVDIINLSADLGMINKTAKMQFLHHSELLKHFASRAVDEELDYIDAQACIKNCVKFVLAMSDDQYAISFTNFRDLLKREMLTDEHEVYKALITCPYFYKRTTVRTLLNLSKGPKGAELEKVFANMTLIIPSIWDDLLSDDRYPIGFAYAEATNEGNIPLVRALKSVLLKVKGFDYVPESLRSNTFVEAATNLLSVHNGMNNFYNEPSAAKLLFSLGTSIPVPALGKCITATLACKLGNVYGVSDNAQGTIDSILSGLTPDRWEYYLNHVLPADETIIWKLTSSTIVKRWNKLVNNYDLNEKNIKDRYVSKLIDGGHKGQVSTVIEAANEIYNKIR